MSDKKYKKLLEFVRNKTNKNPLSGYGFKSTTGGGNITANRLHRSTLTTLLLRSQLRKPVIAKSERLLGKGDIFNQINKKLNKMKEILNVFATKRAEGFELTSKNKALASNLMTNLNSVLLSHPTIRPDQVRRIYNEFYMTTNKASNILNKIRTGTTHLL